MKLFDELLCIKNDEVDRVAFKIDEERVTYNEFHEMIIKTAKHLTELGITKGNKVILQWSNPFEFSLILLAIIYNEAIPMPVYKNTSIGKLEELMLCYDVNYVIVEKGKEISKLTKKLVTSYKMQLWIYSRTSVIDRELDNVKLVLFTSGTTSLPKAIMLTEENVVSNIKAISKYLKLRDTDSILLIKDMCHSSSIIGELFVGLHNRCTMIVTSKVLLPQNISYIINKEKVTILFAVPTILISLCTYLEEKNSFLNTVRIINFYGAPASQKDISRFIKVFNDSNIIYSYGLTEASPRVTYIEKKDLLRKKGSSGQAIENVSFSIVDDNDMELPAFAHGEIIVSGPNVMKGYYKNSEKTAMTIRANGLHTGDVGYYDNDGYLYVVGRKDNMFICGGKNIYPEEIEKVIRSSSKVEECLVKAEDNGKGVISICAYIVLKKGQEMSDNEIYSICKDNIDDYKVPHKYLQVERLEKTPSGKIKRHIN